MNIADRCTWISSQDCLDQPADAWEWLDIISQGKHDAITLLTIHVCINPHGFKVDFDDEEDGWVLLMGKLKEQGYKEPRIKLAACHALAELPASDESDREDVERTEAEIKKLREMLG